MRNLSFFGLTTVVILEGSVLVGLHRAHLALFGKWPLSYLGTFDDAKVLFSGGLLLGAVTMLLFAVYLSRTYPFPRSALAVLVIGQVGQIIAALTPYGGKQPAKSIHTVAALTLAFSIPIFLWLFARAQKPGPFRTLVSRLAGVQIVCVGVGVGGFLFVIKGAPAGEILPAMAFHVWLVVLTFYKPEPKAQAII